jgi:N-acetylglucosamine kinase-like BadF-type ATPase
VVSIFLGIDGGATKTTCAVGDDNSLLATATTGGSNVIRHGEAQARESLQQAVRQACAAAGIDVRQVERTCAGVTGAARPEIAEVVGRALSEVVPGAVQVVGDMIVALHAAFDTGPGIIVITGTGSIAYGRNAHGDTARAGGWGFAISDEGSGYWIGRAAVSATLRAQDEQQDTKLLRQILAAWQLSTLDDLVRAGNSSPLPDFSALFPIVLATAEAGDPIARSVLTQAGVELADLAKTVMRRLFEDDGPVPVAMSGGVFRQSALVRQVFYNSLRSEYPNASLSPTLIEPVKGALELARKMAQES